MDSQIIQQLIIEADKADSLGKVKKSLKDIKDAMLSVGDDGSEDFRRLAKASAELKDRVDETNKAIERTNPDKFNGLAAAAKIGATGIELTTGAMELFGAESEDTQKALLKVQAAMQFAQGLSNIGELKKEFKALWEIIAANPIIAIATAITAIGIGVYKLYQNYQEANSEASKLKVLAEQTKIETEKQVAIAERELSLANARGDSASQIHEIEKKISAQKIYNATLSLKSAEMALKEVEANDSLFESIAKVSKLLAPKWQEEMIQKTIDQNKLERIAEQQKAYQAAFEDLENLKTNDEILDIKYQKALVDNAKKASDEKIKKAEDISSRQKELDDAELAQWLADEQIKNDALDARQKRLEQDLANHLKYVDAKHAAEQKYYDQQKAADKAAADLKKKLNEGALSDTANLFGSISQLLGKHAKAQKGFAIAQATMNTFQGATKALASLPPPFSFLAAAAALAAGLVQVRNIIGTTEDGSGGSSSSASSGSSNIESINTPPPGIQPSTQLDENGNVIPQNNQNPNPQRVYVVESDITHTQNQVAVTESAMRFH